MKIIYEDSNDRSGGSKKPGMKNIGSSVSNVPPAVTSVRSSARRTRKETQSITAEEPAHGAEETAFSGESMGSATESQAEKQNTAPQQPAPEFKLTQEQIAFLLNQYLGSQNGSVPQNVPQSPAVPQNEETSQRAGTRIVFQSDDFDAPREEPRKCEVSPIHIDYGYDVDDEDDEDEYDAPAQKKDALLLPKSSGASKDYVIDEIDISTPRKAAAVRVLPAPGQDISSGQQPTSKTRSSGVQRTPVSKPQNSVQFPSVPSGANAPAAAQENITVSHVEEASAAADGSAPKKKKKRSAADIIRLVVLAISFIAIIISAGKLINEYRLHKENQKLESDLAGLTIEEEETTKKSKKSKKDKKDSKTEQTETTLSTAQKWEQIKEEYPNTQFPEGLQLKYARLYATNNDFVGYLEAKGVNLSLPVVQTDNDDTYLNKNFYGTATKYGCPFVSYINNIETLDMNTVIYGHHMNDKSIFGALDHYKTLDGFKSAPVITFNTLYKNYKWKVIAAFITNADEKDDNGYVFRYYFNNLSTQERFSAYLNELAQRSLYDTGVDVLPTDKLLTLSTCSHEFDDARFVVVARLVRPGEKATVDTSKAAVNENPRYPQAYYTAKKLTNPYYNAARWEVD